MNNLLPSTLEAHDYEETCGNAVVGSGIAIIDPENPLHPVCRLTAGTIAEKHLARLFAASPKLYEWARMAAEETRAIYPDDRDPEEFTPSWLPELEAVIKQIHP